MMKLLLVAAVAACMQACASARGVLAADQVYAGSLTFHPYADAVPLNVTLHADGTADFSWVYDKDASGASCTPDTEHGLKWSIVGSKFVAQGSGKDPAFYSFSGTVAAGTITGQLLNPANLKKQWKGGAVGTFTAKLNGPQQTHKCNPTPPAPAPHATTHAFIWPLPQAYTKGTATATLQVSRTFFSQGDANSSFLTQAFERYTRLTFPHATAAAGVADAAAMLTGLTVSVDDLDDSHPQIDTKEDYTLDIPASGVATLHASTVYGALRGLETFSQLVVFNFESGNYGVSNAPWSVTDSPRFPHRGLMIDSARHFEPLASIRKIIDSLPYAKLNVLHWHMSDSQSYPMQVKSYPKLWDASWSLQERYIQADIADTVEYARMRGVRVMVEFDVPGHAASWCKGYPEVCPSTTCLQPLNVANQATFDLIESTLKECTGGVASKPKNPSPGVFKDNFIHLGGDEVDTSCWSSTPSVKAWLDKQNMTPDQGYAYFVKKVADMAIAQGHRPVQWSEVFDHFKYNLTKETIVHIWKSVTNVTEVVAGGYNVLVNVGYDKLSWYLDNLNVMWDAVYMNEPCVGVPDDLCKLVLGGHGEMWGETVDASDIQSTVWPKLASIAERLWSARTVNDTADAHDRIENFRCLLNRRGIAAAPVNNANARSAPPGPGSCTLQ